VKVEQWDAATYSRHAARTENKLEQCARRLHQPHQQERSLGALCGLHIVNRDRLTIPVSCCAAKPLRSCVPPPQCLKGLDYGCRMATRLTADVAAHLCSEVGQGVVQEPAVKVAEGIIVAGLDPVATDLFSARYLLGRGW